ncbi:hypothetical protein BO78DRAFT_73768 [Aspergillus sclerotiicarbonarius CBS 121057]|uniref:Uncharacterized protein n=1 Tax=Aspergillus sclerotiicarbonarius (strain CBS 121057 / IBT 28362) TaxID=1448318 RepID=A0A319FK95_ASPSB|nr:hypothetical protein BO78DRAFT_73768 [Aspergillus sclerotiicarbonarius CBS 121057]
MLTALMSGRLYHFFMPSTHLFPVCFLCRQLEMSRNDRGRYTPFRFVFVVCFALIIFPNPWFLVHIVGCSQLVPPCYLFVLDTYLYLMIPCVVHVW